LCKPEGWIFKSIPAQVWNPYVEEVRRFVEEKPGLPGFVPYFYQLHDLEHLVAILNIASQDVSTEIGKALYEHLARNWSVLERFSHAEIALVPIVRAPSMRTKPPRALPDELFDFPANFWVARLKQSPFCPTSHGPRLAGEVWLPTPEVERRFGRRGKSGSMLVPTLEVENALLKGKSRGLAQTLEIRDELTPTNFSLKDAHLLLGRLRELYSPSFEKGEDMRQDLREVIRPAYRSLFELLPSRERQSNQLPQQEYPLDHSPLLATDGKGNYQFIDSSNVFYAERSDTKDRIVAQQVIWTFILEALPVARPVLVNLFHVRVLEQSLDWHPQPGDLALDANSISEFRNNLDRLAAFILARIGTDRSVERLVREDARKLRNLFELLEPVESLELFCELDGNKVDLDSLTRDSFVGFDTVGVPSQAFIVWSELAWPPDDREAEALVSALCEVFGSSYFEPFLALVRAKTADERLRLLRRAGAPLDIEEQSALYRKGDL
jgi:hypothetical protein